MGRLPKYFKPAESPQKAESIPYIYKSDWLYYFEPQFANGAKVGETLRKVTNFKATIIGHVVHNDGVEQTDHYELETVFKGTTGLQVVRTEEFQGLRWIDKIASDAVIFPGQTERAGVGIKLLSGTAPKSMVYTHAG